MPPQLLTRHGVSKAWFGDGPPCYRYPRHIGLLLGLPAIGPYASLTQVTKNVLTSGLYILLFVLALLKIAAEFKLVA